MLYLILIEHVSIILIIADVIMDHRIYHILYIILINFIK